MSIKGLQVTQTEIRYIFPRDLSPILQFRHTTDLRALLQKAFSELNLLLPNFPYQISSKKNYVVKCIYCPNTIEYGITLCPEGKIYKMISYCVDHIHGRNFDHQQIWSDSRIPRYFSFLNVSKLVQLKINQLEYKIESSRPEPPPRPSYPKSFQQLLLTLSEKKAYYYYEPQNIEEIEYPDYLLVITPAMKKAYRKHARCIGFDFTYSMIKETPLQLVGCSKRQFMVGMIAGLNKYRRLGIYALIIANEESGHYVQITFRHFLNYMEKQPTSVVTDQAPGILAGLGRLKKSGQLTAPIFWDTFHVLKNYKCRNKQLKYFMRMMVRQKCKHAFHRMYLEAVRIARTEEQMDALHQFMQQSHKYSISQIVPGFVGLGISDSQNQMANNLIKNVIPYESSYPKVVAKAIQFIQERNTLLQTVIRQTCWMEDVIHASEIEILRYSLSKQVFRFLFHQFSTIHDVDILLQDKKSVLAVVQDFQTVYYVQKRIEDQASNQADGNQSDLPALQAQSHETKYTFRCSCHYQEKTGIPCQHLLKVILSNGESVLENIDSYWVIERPQSLQRCIESKGMDIERAIRKRGRPLGKPTIYYEPDNNKRIEVPKGVSTFSTIKSKSRDTKWDKNIKWQEKGKHHPQAIFEQEESADEIKERNELVKRFFQERN